MSLPLTKGTFIIFRSELVWDYFILIDYNDVVLYLVSPESDTEHVDMSDCPKDFVKSAAI